MRGPATLERSGPGHTGSWTTRAELAGAEIERPLEEGGICLRTF